MDSYTREKNSPELFKALGKTISSCFIGEVHHEPALVLDFEEGGTLAIFDNGQSCCEHRYLTCDDELPKFVGATLNGVEFAAGPEIDDPHGEYHETGFVKVDTSLGGITLTTHNEHNGYYGGFSMRITYEEG